MNGTNITDVPTRELGDPDISFIYYHVEYSSNTIVSD